MENNDWTDMLVISICFHRFHTKALTFHAFRSAFPAFHTFHIFHRPGQRPWPFVENKTFKRWKDLYQKPFKQDLERNGDFKLGGALQDVVYTPPPIFAPKLICYYTCGSI